VRRTLIAFLVIFGPALIWFFFIRPIPLVVSVYFTQVTDSEATLVPVTRVIRARSPESRVQGAIAALLAGPSEGERARGLSTEIPAGTTVRAVGVAGGVAAVDLSGDIERGGGSSSMQGRVWQIVYTGTQFTGVSRVRILIDGRSRRALGGEGVLIEEPIGRPAETPRF